MRKTELLIILFLLGVLATGCKTTSTPTSTPGAVTSIEAVALTPGKIEAKVGTEEVKLGATRADVEAKLGKPAVEDTNEFVKGQTYLLYHDKGIELTLQDDKVEQITLHAKHKEWTAYTGGLAGGVGVGSTSDVITKALGAAEEEAPRALTYAGSGLKFRFAADRDSGARAETLSLTGGEL